MEGALALLRFQLEDLLSEVEWVLEDFQEEEAGPGPRCAPVCVRAARAQGVKQRRLGG